MRIDAWLCDCGCGERFFDKKDYVDHLKWEAESRLAKKKAKELGIMLKSASIRYSQRTDVPLSVAFKEFVNDYSLYIYMYEYTERKQELPFRRDKYGIKEIHDVNIGAEFAQVAQPQNNYELLSVYLRQDGCKDIWRSDYYGEPFHHEDSSFDIVSVGMFREFGTLIGLGWNSEIKAHSEWYTLGDKVRELWDQRRLEHELEEEYKESIAKLKDETYFKSTFVFLMEQSDYKETGLT